MSRLKVLHVTNNYPTKNYPVFGIFVKEQINSLSDLGVENEVFFINGREEGRRAYWNGVISLRKKLKNADYDVIHCHHSFSSIILLLTFRFFRYKKIVSYQNPPEREGGMFLYKIIRYFFHGIVMKTKFKDPKGSLKIYYLPNGVDTDFFKPYDCSFAKKKLDLSLDKKYLLFMDSYKRRKQKRMDRFLETVKILKADGNPYNVEELILTNTDRSQIPYYMSASSLHIISSDFEGSPNSVKECLACNTPVVSCPVGNVDDLIGDVSGCFISSSFEPSELSELVKLCLDKDNFNGRDKILAKSLDIKSVAVNLKNIYKHIIA